ncbi:MAG: class I SAM-dependent methyltransferase [Candidatus Binatia bacterium]
MTENASIQIAAGTELSRQVRGVAAATRPITPRITAAYDASSITFRVLRAFGWGPLLNLGYYPFGPPLTVLNFVTTPFIFAPFFRLPGAQLKLVTKSASLLRLTRGSRVLDVGCGRGMSSFFMAHAFPLADITALDLLPQNVATAQTLYGNTPNLTYLEGDAMDLRFPSESFDRVLCLEAAFHFPDRNRFLGQLARITQPGARVVIVDFMSKADRDAPAWNDPKIEVVRQTWQWEYFDSARQYQLNAVKNGFHVEACRDWSAHVTAPLGTVFELVAWLARRRWGRRLLLQQNPLLRSLSDQDWEDFTQSAHAHRYLEKHASYIALILTRS